MEKQKVAKNEEGKQGVAWFIDAIVKRVPWLDILMGLFIPLNVMHYFIYLKKPLFGVSFAFFWCVIYAVIMGIIKKKPSMLGLMTAFMILINFGTSFIMNHPVLFFITEMLDNSIMGIIFLLSLFTRTPLVLLFVEKESLDRVPDNVKETPYYIKAWKIISAAWGVTFVGFAAILTLMKLHHSPFVGIVDIISGWPAVVLLFAFSVTFPKYYWESKHVLNKA
jgi:hypothetical protein